MQGGLPVGSKYTIVVEWMILPIEDAWYEAFICTYNGKPQKGVDYEFATLTRSDSNRYGDTKTAANKSSEDYIALLKPKQNHAWSSKYASHAYDVSTKDVRWKIVNFQMNKPTLIGDSPIYNGDYQYPNVLIFSNYEGHEESAIEFALYSGTKNGTLLAEHQSTLPKKAVNAGTYTLKISIKDEFKNSFSWIGDDGKPTTEDIYIEWKILPLEITGFVDNNKNTWVYDATQKTGKATFNSSYLKHNVLTGTKDQCTFTYTNNKHTDAGTYYFGITDVSNHNYTATYNSNGKYIYSPDSGNYTTHLKMVIQKAPLYIKWTGAKAQQDSGSVSSEFTGEQGSDVLTPVKDGTYSSSTRGYYTAKVTGISGTKKNNYYIASDATTSYSFEVWNDAWDYSDLKDFTFNGSNRTTYVTGSDTVTLSGTITAKNAGTYTATLTPKANCYWSTHGTTGSKTDTWKINKLAGSNVPFNIAQGDYDGAVVFVKDGAAQWNSDYSGYYQPYDQTIADVLGKLPKCSYSTSATHTYALSGYGSVSETTDSSKIKFTHAGDYTLTVKFAGDSNMGSCTRTYNITIEKGSYDASVMTKLKPKYYKAQKKTSIGVPNSEDDQGVNMIYAPTRYKNDYEFSAAAGKVYHYQPPKYKANAKDKEAGEGTTHTVYWTVSSSDMKAYTGTIKVTPVKEEKSGVDGYFASYDIASKLNVGVRTSSSASEIQHNLNVITNYCSLTYGGVDYYTKGADRSSVVQWHRTSNSNLGASYYYEFDYTKNLIESTTRTLRSDLEDSVMVTFDQYFQRESSWTYNHD